RTSPNFPGFYTWATTKHPAKPIMVAEWGVYDASKTVVGKNKAAVYATVLPQLAKLPQIKGLVYFDTAKDQSGHDIRMDDTPQAPRRPGPRPQAPSWAGTVSQPEATPALSAAGRCATSPLPRRSRRRHSHPRSFSQQGKPQGSNEDRRECSKEIQDESRRYAM